ncbi:hypothetical protein BH10PSE12_BH10PSE12_02680 [soil metagenome]
MSYAEYVEWAAFYDIEPFGDARGDLQAALIASASQAPHIKGAPDFNGMILFKEDRFATAEDEIAAIDRILDRAAMSAAVSPP